MIKYLIIKKELMIWIIYSEHNNLNNEQIEEEYCSNIENKKENNNYIKKPKQIKKNSTYNFYDEKEENQNIYNNDINTNNTTNDFFNFNENISFYQISKTRYTMEKINNVDIIRNKKTETVIIIKANC